MRSIQDGACAGPAPGRASASASAPVLPELVEGPLRVRFARDAADLDRVCRLRFEVFNLELGEGLDDSFVTGRDRDEFDAQCHHLMVVDDRSGALVGTYRMQTLEMARAGEGLYCEREFEFGGFPPDVLAAAVELGRACIAKDHRNGNVLFALWRGLAAYASHAGKRYLLGCSSLTSQDPHDGWRMLARLRTEGRLHPGIRLPPRVAYDCGEDRSGEGDGGIAVPRLFHTYLRYGAKVASLPALDRGFKTIDFLVLLDLEAILPRVRSLFFGGLGALGGGLP